MANKYRNHCLSCWVDPSMHLPLAGTFRWRGHFSRSQSTFGGKGHCQWCALVSEPWWWIILVGRYLSKQIDNMDPYHPWDWYIYLHFLVDSYGFHLGIHIQQVPWSMRHGGDSPFGNMCLFPKSGWEDDVPPFFTGGIIRTGNFAGISTGFRGEWGLCEVKTTAKCRRFHIIFSRKINNIFIYDRLIGTTLFRN